MWHGRSKVYLLNLHVGRNTSSLKKHLQKCHKQLYHEVQAQDVAKPAGGSGSQKNGRGRRKPTPPKMKYAMDSEKQKVRDRELAICVGATSMPNSIVTSNPWSKPWIHNTTCLHVDAWVC